MFQELLQEVQRRLEQIAAALSRLEQRVAANEQSTQKHWGLANPPSPASTAVRAYQCQTPASGGPWVATGSFPRTPTNFTADIYTCDASPTSVATGATVYYHGPVSLAESSVVLVAKNPDGSYTVTNLVCDAS